MPNTNNISTAQAEAAFTTVVENPQSQGSNVRRFQKPADAESDEGVQLKGVVWKHGPLFTESYVEDTKWGSKDSVERGETVIACSEEILRLEGYAPTYSRVAICCWWGLRYLDTARKYIQVRFRAPLTPQATCLSVCLLWAVEHPAANFTLQVFKDLWPQIFDRLRLAGKVVDSRLAVVANLHPETPGVLFAQMRPKVAAYREHRNNNDVDAPPPLRALTTSPRAMAAVRARISRRHGARNAPYQSQ